MEDLSEFDNVKAEKAIAMRRYRCRRNLKWLSEACVALFLLARSSSWFPIAAQFCAAFSHRMVAVFRSHLFVFALFNAIIFLVYALSAKCKLTADRHRPAGSDSDLYDEFVSNSSAASGRRISTGGSSAASEPEEEVVFEDKQMVSCSENAASPPCQNCQVAETKVVAASRQGGDAESADECRDREKALVYRRTKSEKRIGEKAGREFRRSDTEIEPGRRSSSVDEMSNDEFNRAIESFITSQKSIQREEYKEERKAHGYVTLALCQ